MSGCGDDDKPEVDPCAELADPCPCEEPRRVTYCDLDTKNNVWMERDKDSPDAIGICLLDTMSECQVINVLERDYRARADLLRVTTDPHLRYLARNVQRLSTGEPMDEEQSDINRNAESIPFYTVFRGSPPSRSRP